MRRWKRGQYVIEWNGKPVTKLRTSWRKAAKRSGLYVTPHSLRHTAATWLMQRGASKWDAAGFLGMSMDTLERVYAKHHPDHQASAVEALDRSDETRDGGLAKPAKCWSEWQDLNLRPLPPEDSALPG